MDWKDISAAISKSAPLLGMAIGGPVGAIVTTGAALLASEFGGDANNPEDLGKLINADPNREQKLVSLESNNKITLQQIALQQAQVEAGEMANARSRETTLAQIAASSGQSFDKTPRQLAITFTWGYLACTAVSMIAKIYFPQLNFDTAIQALNSGEMFILGYYFGSSNKDKRL